MTELAVWEPTTTVARIDSWTTVLTDVASLAQTVATTDFVPEALRGNVPGITAAILYGREIGLPPMQALRSVHLIKGRPALAAEAMRGLSLAAGHEIEYLRADGGTATVRGRRRGSETWHTVTWTIDVATQLGLTRNPSWRTYPRAMLKARATSELCRDIFADVVGGFAAVEDMDVLLDDVAALPETPANAPEKATRTVGRGRRSRPVSDPPADVSDPTTPIPGDGPPLTPTPPVSVPPDVVIPTHVEDPPSPDPGDGMSTPPPDPVPVEPVPGQLPLIPDVSPPLPPEPPDDDTRPDGPNEPASRDQGKAVFGLLGKLGYADVPRAERLAVATALVGRPIASFNDLSRAEASQLIDTLGILSENPDGPAQLSAIVDRSG